MGQLPEKPGPWRCRWKGSRLDRGATLVEYALIAAFVVVGSLAAIERLEEASREETDNQVNCISERPPPSSCQFPAAVPPPDDPGPGDPGDPGDPGEPVDCDDPDVICEDDPEPPPPPPPPPDPIPVSGTFTGSSGGEPGAWFAESDVSLLTDEGVPVEGAVVQVTWTLPSGESFAQTCTTGASGTCEVPETIRFDVPLAGATHVVGKVSNVVVAPPLDVDLSSFVGLCFPAPGQDPGVVCPS